MSVASVLAARARGRRNQTVLMSGLDLRPLAGPLYPGTFTRGSAAWDGVQNVSAGSARRLAYAGGELVLIEGSSTNLTGNHGMSGGTVGNAASDTAALQMPTLWSCANWGSVVGLTRTFVGRVTLPDGSTAIDIRWQGTPDKNASMPLTFAPVSAPTISATSWMSASFDASIVGGSLSNVSIRATNFEGTSNNAYNSETTTPTVLHTTLSATPTRYSVSNMTVKQDGTSVKWTSTCIYISVTANKPVDLTLRVANPQMELRSSPSSLIRNASTSASTTRSPDLWRCDAAAGVLQPGRPWTVAVAYRTNSYADSSVFSGQQPSFSFNSGAANPDAGDMLTNRVGAGYGWNAVIGNGRVAGVASQASVTLGASSSAMVGVWQRVVLTYDGTTFRAYLNGVLKGSAGFDTAAGWTASPSLLTFGGQANGKPLWGWLAPGAPTLGIPFIRSWALQAADIAAEDARWLAALSALTLPNL